MDSCPRRVGVPLRFLEDGHGSGCVFLGAKLAVSPREGLAEFAVLSPKSSYLLMGQFEAMTQRFRAGAAIGGCTGRAACAAVVSELFDLVAQIGLGVEPRPGDSGLSCESGHADVLAVVGHCSESITGSLQRLFMAFSGHLSEPL